jgi:hypothetical protein
LQHDGVSSSSQSGEDWSGEFKSHPPSFPLSLPLSFKKERDQLEMDFEMEGIWEEGKGRFNQPIRDQPIRDQRMRDQPIREQGFFLTRNLDIDSAVEAFLDQNFPKPEYYEWKALNIKGEGEGEGGEGAERILEMARERLRGIHLHIDPHFERRFQEKEKEKEKENEKKGEVGWDLSSY